MLQISGRQQEQGKKGRGERKHSRLPSCPTIGLPRSILSTQAGSSSQEPQAEVFHITSYQILSWTGRRLDPEPFACKNRCSATGTSLLMPRIHSTRANFLPEGSFWIQIIVYLLYFCVSFFICFNFLIHQTAAFSISSCLSYLIAFFPLYPMRGKMEPLTFLIIHYV